MKGYDIIGDIHGHASALERLLEKLGYGRKSGSFRHPGGRRVIFLGDYIDRGPEIPAVLEIVRGMVESGEALAILGNHEINALRFHTTGSDGRPLRRHGSAMIAQHAATLDQFANRRDLAEWLSWFSLLPLALEIDGLRAVHACWDERAIRELARVKQWSGRDLEAHSIKGTDGHEMISRVVNGPEARLPDGYSHVTADGRLRWEVRVKWWLPGEGISCRDWVFPEDADVPDLAPVTFPETGYARRNAPTFFGHYAIKAQRPRIQREDLACIDYGAGKGGVLAAYRWSGEQALNVAHFVTEVTA